MKRFLLIFVSLFAVSALFAQKAQLKVGRHYCHPSKLFYRFQMALVGIFRLTLQKNNSNYIG